MTEDPDPYLALMVPDPGGPKTYGSGAATLENAKKFHVLKCWMFSVEGCTVGFFCILDVLHRGLEIKKFKFLIQKRVRFFS
jgi:hypothetical protein